MRYKKLIFSTSLGVIVFIAILKYMGFNEFLAIVSQVSPKYLAAAVIIHYFGFVLRAYRWKIILDSLEYKVGVAPLFIYTMVGWFASSFVPARGGDALRVYMLKNERDVPLKNGLTTIIVERLLDISSILVFSSLFAYLALKSKIPQWVITTYYVIIIFFVILIVVFLAFQKTEKKFLSLSDGKFYQKVIDVISTVIGSIYIISKKKVNLINSIVLSMIIWFCDVFLVYFVFFSINNPIHIKEVAFVIFTTDLIASMPITPGGVGQIELAIFSLFLLIDVPKDIAGSVVIISRFITYWSFILVSGLISYSAGISRVLEKAKK